MKNPSNPKSGPSPLDVQALVDGELSDDRAAEIMAQIAADPEAQALEARLASLVGVIRQHEPGHSVPVSREYYFASIERGIERGLQRETMQAQSAGHAETSRESHSVASGSAPWWRWFTPVFAVASLVVLVTVLSSLPGGSPTTVTHSLTSVTSDDAASGNVGSLLASTDKLAGDITWTYQSDDDALTIHWIN